MIKNISLSFKLKLILKQIKMEHENLGQGRSPEKVKKSEMTALYAASFMLFVVGLSLVITYGSLKAILITLMVIGMIALILLIIAAVYCYRQFRNITKDVLGLDLTPEDLK